MNLGIILDITIQQKTKICASKNEKEKYNLSLSFEW